MRFILQKIIRFMASFQSDMQVLETAGRDVSFVETWRAVEKLQEAGLARAVGVSNFSIEQLREILNSCKIKPAANQVCYLNI